MSQEQQQQQQPASPDNGGPHATGADVADDGALTPRGSGARAVRMLQEQKQRVNAPASAKAGSPTTAKQQTESSAAAGSSAAPSNGQQGAQQNTESQKSALELGLSEWQVEQHRKSNQWKEDEINRHEEALGTLPATTPRGEDDDDDGMPSYVGSQPSWTGSSGADQSLKNIRFQTFEAAYKAIGGRTTLNQYRYASQDFESFLPEIDFEDLKQEEIMRCFEPGVLAQRAVDVFPSFTAVLTSIREAFIAAPTPEEEERPNSTSRGDAGADGNGVNVQVAHKKISKHQPKVPHRVLDVRHLTEPEMLREEVFSTHDGDFIRLLNSVSATIIFPTLKALYEGLNSIGELPLLQSHLYRVVYFEDLHQQDVSDDTCLKQIRILLSLEGYICEIILISEPMYQASMFQARERRRTMYRRLLAQVIADNVHGAAKTLSSPYLNARSVARSSSGRSPSRSSSGDLRALTRNSGDLAGAIGNTAKDSTRQQLDMSKCCTTKQGLSMLHVAVLHRSPRMVDLLLAHGFDPLEASCGHLAFETAVVQRQWNIATAIFAAMAPDFAGTDMAILHSDDEDDNSDDEIVVVSSVGDGLNLGDGGDSGAVEDTGPQLDQATIQKLVSQFSASSHALESIHRCIQIVFEMSFASALRVSNNSPSASSSKKSSPDNSRTSTPDSRRKPRSGSSGSARGLLSPHGSMRSLNRTWSQVSGLGTSNDDIPDVLAGGLVDLVLVLDQEAPKTIWHDWASNRTVLTAMRFISERAKEPLGQKLLQLLNKLDSHGRTPLDIAAHKRVDAENVVSFLLRIGSRLETLHKSNVGPRSFPRLSAFYDAALLTVTRRVREDVYNEHDSSLALCQVIKTASTSLAEALPEAQRMLPRDNPTVHDALQLQDQLPRCRDTARHIMDEGERTEFVDLSPYAAICDGMAISVLSMWWRRFCPLMRVVNISHCSRLKDEDLEILVSAVPRLEVLRMPGCIDVGDRGIRAVARKCFRLETIDISQCELVTDDSLVAIGGGCPRLVELNASGCSAITTAGIKELAGGCQQLHDLRLGGCENVDDEGLKAIGAGLPRLKILDLTGCISIGDTGMQACLEGCIKIERLVLRGCDKLTDRSIVDVSKYLPHLMALDVSACDQVTAAGLAPLGQGGCVELRDLQLSGCEKITDNVLIELGSCQQPPGSAPPEIYEKAQRIDMFSEEDNRWFPGKVTTIVKNKPSSSDAGPGPWYNVILADGEGVNGVSHSKLRLHRVGCRDLEILNISGCALIGNAGLQALAKGCPSIKKLDLNYCTGIKSQGVLALATYCKHIQEIGFDSCEKLSSDCLVQFAGSCSELRSINFFDCKNVGDSVLKAIGANCPNLIDIDLSNCVRISADGLRDLSTGCKNLATLDLTKCTVVDDDAMKALHGELPSLQVLSLNGCRRLTGAGIQALAPKTPKLKTLSLKFCPKIEDSGLEALGRHCPLLQTLELANCERLTDEGVKNIARGCPGLQILDLSFCKNITSASVRALCGSGGVAGVDNLRSIRLVSTEVDDAGKIKLKECFNYIDVVD